MPTNTSKPLWTSLSSKKSVALTALLLTVITLAAFGRAASFDFVSWDDNLHVFANPHLVTFDIDSLRYFWFHSYQEMYIPVSYTIFGILNLAAHRTVGSTQLTVTGTPLDPHVFHCANLALHVGNVLLVFLLVRRLTRDDPASLFGALLFALHPMQVESVVWISELRGLLGAAFTLVSLHLFLNAAERDEHKPFNQSPYYWLSIVTTVLALLSKPSSVVIPLFLALIARYGLGQSVGRLAIEISPFAAISVIIAVLTNHVQSHPPGQMIAIWLRPLIACDALCFYIAKLLVPINLSIDYGRTPTWVLIHKWTWFELVIPVAISAPVIYYGRTKQYLRFSALFWLFALLPVLGLTPFVFQEKSTTADRYMYLALVGIALLLSYALSSLRPPAKKIASLVVSLWLGALFVLTFLQTDVWKNSLTLFTQAVAVDEKLPDMQNNLGGAMREAGDYNGSIAHLLQAVALDPNIAVYHDDLAISYIEVNDTADAEVQFRQAVAAQPEQFLAYYDLGLFLIRSGRGSEGAHDLQRALTLDPAQPAVAEQLGDYYQSKGLHTNAIQAYSIGVNKSPQAERIWRKLGVALYSVGRNGDAIDALNRAVALNPSDQAAQNTLNMIEQGSLVNH